MSDKPMVHVGEAALLQGQFEKAYWSHNAAFYLGPFFQGSQMHGDPSQWQRGLSCFYSGHYHQGARQFECDMSGNGSDVEEIIWHFLCRCGADGYQRALSSGLLSLRPRSDGGDLTLAPPVPPMLQVLELYKGTGLVQDVLASATSTDGAVVKSYNDTNALAYAHFYIGFHHEIRREFSQARKHFQVAAELENPDYIGRIMRMHFDLFCLKFPSQVFFNNSKMEVQSKIVQGGWQLSKGHLIQHEESGVDLVMGLLGVVDAGVRSFDCGDIYTGVEVLYGRLIKAHCLRGGRSDDITIHTKLVPDLEVMQNRSVNRKYVESSIRRSLNRIGVKSISLVQFHWWDMSIPGCIEALLILKDLVLEGVIEKIGITNFDTACTKAFVDADIQIASTQVQYSLLDRRPLQSGLVDLCEEHQIDILAYGVLAGGFLTNRWLGRNKPRREDLSNRSLIKYLLIIEEFGGWELFQELLKTLKNVADRHSPFATLEGVELDVSIAMVAMSYILGQRQVKSVIIGAHNDKYLQSTVAAAAFALEPADVAEIESILVLSTGPGGSVYGLERGVAGPHASIMKYNLSQLNQAAHLEELCHRYLELHFEGHPVEATRTGYRYTLSDPQLLKVIDQHGKDFDFTKTALSSLRTFGYDHFIGPCSESEIEKYCFQVAQMLQEAEGINEDALSPDQLVDLAIIISQLNLELVQWQTMQVYKKDPAFYLPLNSILYLLPSWGPEANSSAPQSNANHPGVASMSIGEKLLAVLSRLRAIPSGLIEAHRNLTQPLRMFVLTALEICEPFSSFLASDLPVLCESMMSGRDQVSTDFNPVLDEIKSATAIAAESVKKYATFLRDDLLTRASTPLGVGKEAYEKILKYSHFIDSSEELLALGEEHFKKTGAELESLASEIDSTKSWKEITRDLIRPMHPTANHLLQAYMDEIQCCRDHMMSHDLVSGIPEDEDIVGFSTPKFLLPFSPVGDYLNPSPFAGMGGHEKPPRIGHLMLHSIEAQKLSKPEEQKLLRGHDYTWISVVSPHESYPGHHVQALHAQDHPRILRKYYESIPFYEGWGLYTEELAYETGFFEKELSFKDEGSGEIRVLPAALKAKLTRLTQLRLRLWRAARVILDVKLNTGELSYEACREFLHEEVMFNPTASKGEAFMYVSRPGYAPCYLAGFVKIMELREKLKRQKGMSFHLKEFHDTLLSKGCVPFKLLTILL